MRKRRANLLVGLALGLMGLAFCPPGTAQPAIEEAGRETLREAREFIETGRYLEAAGLLKELAETAPWGEIRARAQKLTGDVLSYWLEKGGDGLSAYREALQGPLGPADRAAALFNFGMLSYERLSYADAVEALEAYLREFPQSLRAATAHFMVQRARRRAEEPPTPTPAPKRPEAERPLEPPERAPARPGSEPQIRVRLFRGNRSVRLASEGNLTVRLPGGGGELNVGPSALVEVRSGRLAIAGRWTKTSSAEVFSPTGMARLNGSPYRGRFAFRVEGGGLLVINKLGLEGYLRGVVPKEMIPSWPIEALKAQAVAARTYVLYQMEKRRDRSFDVDATVLSQVYGGVRAERPSTDRAVAETRGQVLRSGNRLVLAYFHANSGGFTEDAGNVWRVSLPYLRSVEDPYSSRRDSSWNYGLSLSELSRRLRRRGVRVGRIERVVPLGRYRSGRIKAFRVEGIRGSARVSGNRFRMGVGAGRMRSTLAELYKDGGRLVMRGRGFGHGVGMSQWGANVMAKRGMSYREILSFYYPGTRLSLR